MKQVLLASAAVLGIAYATPVVAQDAVEDEAAAKDDIVVTATRSETLLSNTKLR